MDLRRTRPRARKVGVILGPSSYFAAHARTGPGPADSGVRLCIGNAPERDQLTVGLTRLRDILDQGPSHPNEVRV